MAGQNWLWGPTRLERDYRHCWKSGWDNDISTLWSQALFAAVHLVAVATIIAQRTGGRSGQLVPELQQEHDSASRKERLWHLDYARVVCVACVVAEHTGGTMHTHFNVFVVQQWVLPFLFVTSGMGFMFSSLPLWKYELRLVAVFLVGSGANLLADIIIGRDWLGNPLNTIFQMNYVAALILLGVVAWPLRLLLRLTMPPPGQSAAISLREAPLAAVSVLVYAVVALVGLGSVVLRKPMVSEDAEIVYGKEDLFHAGPWILAEVLGLCALVGLACFAGATRTLGWLVLVVIFVPRVFIPWPKVGYAHTIQLYILGLVAARLPLPGQDKIKSVVRAYWPLLLAVLMFMNIPSAHGRCDLNPAGTTWHRFRFYAIELSLVVAFLCGAFNTSDEYGVTKWLGHWALYAYCFHVAWYRVLPEPYGAVVTYASIPLFFAMWQLGQRRTRRRVPKAVLTDADLEATPECCVVISRAEDTAGEPGDPKVTLDDHDSDGTGSDASEGTEGRGSSVAVEPCDAAAATPESSTVGF